MNTLRYFIYLRKSSEAEERQELSIPAQLRELTEYAERHSLTVIGQPLEESQSAMTPGRPVFGDMMKAVEKKKADGILCWKLDRLARNPLDSGRLMQSIADGILKEVRTPDYVYNRTGADKMLLALQFGMATKYSDDLSDNVKRGNREALLRGFWPNRAPLGYKRDHDTNRIIADPERFPVVQEMWRMLLSGVPILSIRAHVNAQGFTTPNFRKHGGTPLGRSHLYRLFQDCFYAGLMKFNGEIYQGSHPAAVTLSEFEQARTILKNRQQWVAPPEKPFFVYRGLITCGSCGGQVTVKSTTNRFGRRYTHYYCWKKNSAHLYCPEGAVRESAIDQALHSFLGELAMPPTWLRLIMSKLDGLTEKAQQSLKKTREKQAAQLQTLDGNLDRLRALLVQNIITTEEYQRDRAKLFDEQLRLRGLLAEPLNAGHYLEPWRSGISLLSKAKDLFLSAEGAKKREFAKTFTLNLFLKDKKVRIEAKKPFSIYREWQGCPNSLAFWDLLRTHILQEIPKTNSEPSLLR